MSEYPDNKNTVKSRVLKYLTNSLDDSDYATLDALIRNGGVSVVKDRAISDFDKRFPDAGRIKLER